MIETLTLLLCPLLVCQTPDQLRALPHVAEVNVRAAEAPTHRVIHLLDWHYVPEKQFLLDTPDGDYEQFLNEVDHLQKQQREFIKATGIKSVYLEGLTKESLSHFRHRIETLKKYKPPTGDGGVAFLVRRLHREDCLQLGAPGALLLKGELDEVLPADDAAAHKAASPIKDGKLVFDEAKNREREQAIAKLLLAQKESVVVLGGEHDMSDTLPVTVEYVRVKLEVYNRASGRE